MNSEDWPEVRLGDVAAVRSGFAFKSADWTLSGVPVVKIANVKEGCLDFDACSYVSEETSTDAAQHDLREGDVLIGMTGYIGDVARVPAGVRAVLNQFPWRAQRHPRPVKMRDDVRVVR